MYLNLFHELIRFDRRHYLAKFGICELFSTTIPSTVLATEKKMSPIRGTHQINNEVFSTRPS
jgi:hypothetical protein